jgi:large subunit ribosomal protein L22
MITRAVLRYVRITPRKFRQIIPLVKGKRPEEAIAILTGVKKGASKYGIDVINSAINNVKRKQGVDTSELYISNFIANGGPMLKRFRAASMGRASMIKKRTSHITVELDIIPKEATKKDKPHAVKNTVKEAAKEKQPETKMKKTAKKGKE